MSVESTALDRSKLEQKDRSELAAIVEAMGGKATTRAKKADLVDQILQLAGVDADPAPGGDAPGTADQAAPTPSDAADAPDDGGPSLPEPEVRLPDGATGSDEEPLAEWELAFGGDPGEGGQPANGTAPRGQAQPQGGGQGTGGGQGAAGDDGESGNRRRRRRGRD